MYPWIVGPLVASVDFMQFLGHDTPVGVLSEFAAKIVRDHFVPLLSVVPGALIALGVLIVSRLGRGAGTRPKRPFEPHSADLHDNENAR